MSIKKVFKSIYHRDTSIPILIYYTTDNSWVAGFGGEKPLIKGVKTLNPSTQQAEGRGTLWVQGHPGLHSEFQDTQS